MNWGIRVRWLLPAKTRFSGKNLNPNPMISIRTRSLCSAMARSVKSFYDLSAVTLAGDPVDFNVYRGRVVLVENVASL
uniref:Uncharacterized protein n=1 Tax=Callorhinchus milii TaxID=7868 RepID=A0A4W3I5K3_CALMI